VKIGNGVYNQKKLFIDIYKLSVNIYGLGQVFPTLSLFASIVKIISPFVPLLHSWIPDKTRSFSLNYLEIMPQLLETDTYEDDRLLLTLRDRQLRTLFETTLDAIAIADDEGRYLDVNPATCELFGLERDELLGLSIANFAEPGFDFRAVWEEFQQQEKMRGEFRLIRADGERRVVECAATANFLPHRHLSVLRDITDRKRAEEQVCELTEQLGGRVSESLQELRKTQAQLQESQERLNSILTSVEEVVWSIHPLSFETIYINPPVEEIYGYSVADFAANPRLWFETVHPEDKSLITDVFARLSRHRKTSAEYRIIRKDGQVRHLSVKSYLILDATGKAIRIDGTTVDITDRINAKNLLEKTVRHVPGAICQLRQRPDGTFHFPYASTGLKATCGVSPEEVQEDAIKAFAFIHEDDRDRVVQAMMESAANLTPWYCEYRTCLLMEGRVIWVLGHATPQREADGGTIWHGYIRDITEQKTTELALAESEAKNRAILQSIPDIIFRINRAEVCLSYFNPRGFSDVLDDNVQLVGRSMAEYLPPEIVQRNRYRLNIALETRQTQIYEQETTIAGHTQFEEVRVVPIDDRHEVMFMIRDISDRKRAELALAESESHNRALLQAIPDMMFRISKAGIYLGYSTSTELLDLSSQQEVGKNMADYLSPEHYQRHMSHLAIALETGQAQLYEQEVTIEGHFQCEEVRVIPLENYEEALFMIRDIGDRKRAEADGRQAEAQLKEVSERLSFALKSGGIGCWEWDIVHQSLLWDDRMFELYGVSKDSETRLAYEVWSKGLHPNDRAANEALINQAILGEAEFNTEFRVIHPDGSIHFLKAFGLVQRDADGVPQKMVGVNLDITDRKRQEKAFRLIVEGTAAKTGEEFFRSCVQYLAQVLDVRYAFIAEFADSEKNLATTRAFWAGDDFSNNFIYSIPGSPNEHSLREFCLYPNAVQALFPEDLDLVTLKVESYAGLPILDDEGNALGLLVVMDTKPMVQDTETQSAILRIFATRAGAEIERLQAEESVRRSELQLRLKSIELETTLKKLQSTQTQLIQAEKMSGLGQLVAGIAHEINNPVGFILGNLKPAADYASNFIELIQLYQTHYPSPPAVISDFQEDIDLEYIVPDFSSLLKSIKTGATRIQDIVKSLRTFSRLDETGLKAMDLHESIDSTLAVLQSRMNGRSGNPGVHITKNYDNLPPVEAHGSLLNQVFMSLVVNALDAIEQQHESLEPTRKASYQSRITITTSKVSKNQVLISIQDNGCGMCPEVAEKIFNPFFTTKPVGKGTGMGLATSYQIIEEQHQGRISVNSTPGEGTEFILVLPIKQ